MCKIKSTQSASEHEPEPPQNLAHAPPDETEAGLPDEHTHPADTIPEGAEYLGSYPSIPAYLRAMLEPEVSPACGWILDLLDYPAVQRRWERDGGRLVCERGQVFRVAAPVEHGDPPGPWMPTWGE